MLLTFKFLSCIETVKIRCIDTDSATQPLLYTIFHSLHSIWDKPCSVGLLIQLLGYLGSAQVFHSYTYMYV